MSVGLSPVELARDLCAFVDASPSPTHAAAVLATRLTASGSVALDEGGAWSLAAGDRVHVVRGGSVAAVVVGSALPSDAGFRIVGAHTDSPTLKVRPGYDVRREGLRLLGAEVYGGPLLHTWLDRDCTLAGRVAVRSPSGAVTAVPVVLPGAPLRIPSLAIHLHREVNADGLLLNAQTHMVPLWGLEGAEDLLDAVADAASVGRDAIVGHDLVLAPTQPSTIGGRDEAFVFAPRLDNLASCHAAVTAIAGIKGGPHTSVLIANDHEEVGSASATGASGPFLEEVLTRVAAALGDTDPQSGARARSKSLLVSCDMAHAAHPNYAERHESQHRPRLGGGPVLKVNAQQRYATDAVTGGWFAARCADAGVALQRFVTRGDLPCGSTIGPLTATRLGIPTVDVGAPTLSMHSAREQSGVADVGYMVAALGAHWAWAS